MLKGQSKTIMEEELAPSPTRYSASISIWKIFAFLLTLIIFLFVSSIIICSIDERCTNSLPTIKNLLNSGLATPYLVSGFNAALVIHLITATFLYYMTAGKAPYWSALQMFFAVIMYASCVITLFVLPFTNWTNNWANIATLVLMVIWMIFVQVSLKRTRHPISILFAAMMLYVICVLIYIVVRAVPDIPLQGRDVGILVVEIIGALALVVFMCVCITHIYQMSIQISTNKTETD